METSPVKVLAGVAGSLEVITNCPTDLVTISAPNTVLVDAEVLLMTIRDVAPIAALVTVTVPDTRVAVPDTILLLGFGRSARFLFGFFTNGGFCRFC